MADISKIVLPNNVEYNLKDASAVHDVDSELFATSTNPVENKAIFNSLHSVAVSQNLAVYKDGIAGQQLPCLTVQIKPRRLKNSKSFGVSTPASLGGYDTIKVHHSKKNLFDITSYGTSESAANDYAKIAVSTSNSSASSTTATVVGVAYSAVWLPLPGGLKYAITCPSRGTNIFRAMACGEYPVSINEYKSGLLLSLNNSSATSLILEAPSSTRWVGIAAYTTSSPNVSTFDDAFAQLQVEVADTATSYEAFSGSHYSVSVPQEVGAIYAGKLDVTNGKLIVTHAIKTFDGTETWNGINYGSLTCYASYLSDVSTALQSDENHVASYGWCSHTNYAFLHPDNNNYGVDVLTFEGTTTVLFRTLSAMNVSSAADMKTWCATQNSNGTPLQVVYPIRTPVVYNVTANTITLYDGINCFWSNAGSPVVYERMTDAGRNYAKAILASIPNAQGVSF